MNLNEQQYIRLLDALRVLQEITRQKCCWSCEHFKAGDCALHGQVPLDFQPQGCEQWARIIPF